MKKFRTITENQIAGGAFRFFRPIAIIAAGVAVGVWVTLQFVSIWDFF